VELQVSRNRENEGVRNSFRVAQSEVPEQQGLTEWHLTKQKADRPPEAQLLDRHGLGVQVLPQARVHKAGDSLHFSQHCLCVEFRGSTKAVWLKVKIWGKLSQSE